jgi:AcrR family transcriptional regulator
MSAATTHPGELEAALGSIGTAAVPSALSERLANAAHPETLRAFHLARRRFLGGERIDMGALAAELGVDRTSLYRWVGTRDALLVEVLWSLAAPTMSRLQRRLGGTGAGRMAAFLGDFVDALIEAPYFRDFLHDEPARALRLLTTRDAPIQQRFVSCVESLVGRELDAGTYTCALPRHDLAYLLVRISESFTYADLIAGERPDAARARAAFAFVLGAP